jgi:hypothetical protein
MDIVKLKSNQLIVLYENFFEWDCFGSGDWSDKYQIFNSKKESLDFIKKHKENPNFRNFVGPLQKVK